MAEHYNMRDIASAAIAVAISHVAAGTRTIRVGTGGVMLPNYSSLVIAEQFGTPASLFSDRINLGLGRAPGSDQIATRALRRDPASAESFPQDVLELQVFLSPAEVGQRIVAVPGNGTQVPLWILGFSTFDAAGRAARDGRRQHHCRRYPTPKPVGWRLRNKCRSPTCIAACAILESVRNLFNTYSIQY